MSNPDLKDLDTSNEIDLTVRGRNSGQDISRPVWFVHEDDKLFLLPVQGSDTMTITNDSKVKEIIEKFRSKYGNSNVQKYYSKFDVGIEFALK